jgi:hypothetical protein
MDERWVGTDRVRSCGDRLIIETRTAMGWEVRPHRRLLIRFDERAWTPRHIEHGKDGASRYELEPWTPAPLEIPGGEIEYGPAYVERRDRAAASRARCERMGTTLNLVSPLVGLLGARLKGRIEEQLGIDARIATVRSVAIELLLVGPAMAIVAMQGVATGVAGEDAGLPWRTCAVVAVVFASDALVRWGRLIAEERPPVGFLEWIWRRRR